MASYTVTIQFTDASPEIGGVAHVEAARRLMREKYGGQVYFNPREPKLYGDVGVEETDVHASEKAFLAGNAPLATITDTI